MVYLAVMLASRTDSPTLKTWRVAALGAILLVTTGAGNSRKEERTDAVRNAIRSGLSFSARVRVTTGSGGQSIQPKHIEAAAEETKAAVSECLLIATRRVGPVSGEVEFSLAVGTDGVVSACEARDAPDDGLARCLERAIATLNLGAIDAPSRAKLVLKIDASRVGPVVEAAFRDAARQGKRSTHQVALQWPVENSKVTSGFGRRPDPMGNRWKFHGGVDLKAKMHQPILAAAAGTVVSTGWKTSGGGIKVVLQHGNGLTTSYGHLFKASVTEGQWVETGQVVGTAGMTGMITWPHLHFEVALGGKKLDPMRFLGKVVDLRSIAAETAKKKRGRKRANR